jgi:hypothetical protein
VCVLSVGFCDGTDKVSDRKTGNFSLWTYPLGWWAAAEAAQLLDDRASVSTQPLDQVV